MDLQEEVESVGPGSRAVDSLGAWSDVQRGRVQQPNPPHETTTR